MATATKITNPELAERLGIHYTMASRLLNGKRLPSLQLMARIESELGWSMAAQTKARLQGADVYSAALRKHLARRK